MEVHHHTHTPREKWSHYFWEFLMLFLAVTLGFFVENQREHYIEGKREKQYINSLYQDLKDDTVYLNDAVKTHDLSCRMIDTLIRLLKSKERNSEANRIYYLARMVPFRDQGILSHDKTYEQMKSSGMLRLIHDQKILDSISGYYELHKWVALGPSLMQIDNRQELYLGLDKLFDMSVFQEMVHSQDPFTPGSPSGEPVLMSNDAEDINAVCARYHFMFSVKQVLRETGRELSGKAARLIDLLKKEYHLE